MIRWALVALVGAALAAPFPILELSTPGRTLVAPLAGAAFAYVYRQSIYDVPVREELRVTDDGSVAIDRALSSDIRALEYFRWPGRAESAGSGMLAWRAPENATGELRIVVVKKGDQAIETGVREVALADAFGEDASVTVRPGRRPLIMWLWALLP